MRPRCDLAREIALESPEPRAQLHLTLKGWVGVEDLSPKKDRTCIKRTIKRGAGPDETPRYRYECTIDLKVRAHLPNLAGARALFGTAPGRLAPFGR